MGRAPGLLKCPLTTCVPAPTWPQLSWEAGPGCDSSASAWAAPPQDPLTRPSPAPSGLPRPCPGQQWLLPRPAVPAASRPWHRPAEGAPPTQGPTWLPGLKLTPPQGHSSGSWNLNLELVPPPSLPCWGLLPARPDPAQYAVLPVHPENGHSETEVQPAALRASARPTPASRGLCSPIPPCRRPPTQLLPNPDASAWSHLPGQP